MKQPKIGFVRTLSRFGGYTRSVQPLKTVMWWRSLSNYNPPHRTLSCRHLAVIGAPRTLCGASIPKVLFPDPRAEEFGEGHSDCKRCKAGCA